jgi:Methyltransferase domain
MSDAESAEAFITEAFLAMFGRAPATAMLRTFARKMNAGESPTAILSEIRKSELYKTLRGVDAWAAHGHYYSPIVDPETVKGYWEREINTAPGALPGIELDLDAMVATLHRWSEVIDSGVFPDERQPGRRFFAKNINFPLGDAMVLRALIADRRPRRIIEIGSGNSTMCMLDALDEFGLTETKIWCIDPNLERLQRLLPTGDRERVVLRARPVQTFQTSFFRSLEENDLLFIDSTHVVKTGSDVHSLAQGGSAGPFS